MNMKAKAKVKAIMSEPIYTIQFLTAKDLKILNDLRNFYYNADLDSDASALVEEFNRINNTYQESLKNLVELNQQKLRNIRVSNNELLKTGYDYAFWSPQSSAYVRTKLSAKDLTDIKSENNKITKLLDKLSFLWLKVLSLRRRLDG